MNNNTAKKEFNEILSKIVEYAAVSGNIISKETIHAYFKDLITDEKMYDYIYKYLTDIQITVEGYKSDSTSSSDKKLDFDRTANPDIQRKVTESNEALAFYEMYLNEIHTLTADSASQMPKLFHSLISGNSSVAGSLAELYLPLVLKISEDFDNLGLSHSDLVAEGNLALYEAVLNYTSPNGKIPDIRDFEQYITSRITNSLKSAVNEEIGSFRISSHLTDQINALNDASTELAKELGREATLEELCEKLSLGEDEVKELMKISINALTVVQTEDD